MSAPRMRLVLLAALLALLSLGCSDSDPEEEPSPVASPSTAAPADIVGSWIVYTSKDGVYAAALDGGRKLRLNTVGSVRPQAAAYSGFVRSDDDVTVFVTDVLADNRKTLGFAVVKVSLATGAVAEVLRYEAPGVIWGSGRYLAAAALSPDGEQLAYSDATGLRVRVLETGDERLVINHERPPDAGDKCCPMYGAPLWAGNGTLVLTKTAYEGSTFAVIDVDDPDAVPRELPNVSGDVNVVSPDGRYVCAYSEGFAPAGLHIVDLESLESSEWLVRIAGDGAAATGCAWSSDGRLAFGRVRLTDNGSAGEPRLTVIQDAGRGRVDDTLGTERFPYVVGWLPGDGVIISERPTCPACGDREPQPAISASNPLPIERGNVLAVIP